MPAKAEAPPRDRVFERMRALHRARRKFCSFAHFVGRDKRGKPFIERPDTRLMCDSMEHAWETQRSLSVVATPGIGKSTFARLFALWLEGRDPSLCVVVTSADRSVSRNMVSLCRQIVLASPEFAAVWPEVMPDEERSRAGRGWRMDEFFLRRPEGAQTADPSVKAMAAEPKAEALRVDLLVADDMMTGKVARSDTTRNAMKDAFQGTWRGRLASSRGPGEDGIFLTLSNCWHREDLGHDLLRDKRATSLWLGVAEGNRKLFVRITNPLPDHPLLANPERYEAELAGQVEDDTKTEFTFHLPMEGALNPEALDAEERASPENFRRNRRLRPSGDASIMFPGWRAGYRQGAPAARLIGPGAAMTAAGETVIDPDFRDRYIVTWGFDIAGDKRHGDALAVCVASLERVEITPAGLWRGNWGIAETASLFDRLCSLGLDPDMAFLENNGVQSKLVNELKRHNKGDLWRHKVRGFLTGRNKADPTEGLPGLALDFEAQRTVWPGGMGDLRNDAAERFRALESILDHCPRVLNAGETDDVLMAFWFAWSAANLVLRRRARNEQGNAVSLAGIGFG